MKQIFDWMRKQRIKVFELCDGTIGVELSDVQNIINEAEAKFAETECGKCSKRSWYQKGYADAEAKWEADCCEWKNPKDCKRIFKAHEKIVAEYTLCIWNFCPYGGKPIKISEVE